MQGTPEILTQIRKGQKDGNGFVARFLSLTSSICFRSEEEAGGTSGESRDRNKKWP